MGHHQNFLHGPMNLGDSGRNRWRGLDRAVDLHKVVDHEVERDRMHVLLDLRAEAVGKPCESAHAHAH